jgi:hypothetical protein
MEVVDGKPVLYLMKASKTAVKAFDGYVAEVASAAKRPLRGVMTHIFFDTESKYPSQRWSMTGMADNDTIMLAQGALDNARHMLNVEPSRKTEAAEETKKPAKKAAGKR